VHGKKKGQGGSGSGGEQGKIGKAVKGSEGLVLIPLFSGFVQSCAVM
jgi:hypothetical protein